MTEPLERTALVWHVFLHESIGEARLLALWDELTEGLGPAEGVPERPERPEAPGRLLAMRRVEVTGGFRAAAVYRLHDTVCISSAHTTAGTSWAGLQTLPWDAGTVPDDQVIGTATVHVGHWPGKDDTRTPTPPVEVADRAWADRRSRTDDRIDWWDLPAGDDRARQLLVMSARTHEPDVSRFLWRGPGRTLPWLTRYLAHAARLRYQRKLLDDRLPALRRAGESTTEAATTLAQLLADQALSARDLEKAGLTLTDTRVEQGGLITAAADVRDMVASVRGTTRNLDLMTASGVMSEPGGPVDADRAVADWLAQQLRVEAAYLDSARLKADELSRLAGEAVSVQRHRRQEFQTLLQTAILGGLLMALTAVQSLGYRIPVPDWSIPRIIVAVTAVAVLLPVALASWQWLQRRRSRREHDARRRGHGPG
ncbi:CATRA conflict system CASPASE/TPR repeat-associated protein [Actinoplanes sp. HUAS TT8]|uniref:CATRA conflict system CASPASE/TPR repeat-associated protein n=1 Tax=Actinoplanes sp. HUAS TT8 TaxID=3447453 RepID=UPI003F5216FA